LGKSATQTSGISDETIHAIDEEIRAIIDGCYEKSRQILEDNMDKLHLMADALMKYETIDRKQIDEIMQGREPGPPQSWLDGNKPDSGDSGPNSGATASTDADQGSDGAPEDGGGSSSSDDSHAPDPVH